MYFTIKFCNCKSWDCIIMIYHCVMFWIVCIKQWKLMWMNEWCIHLALYCVLLYTQRALRSCGGGLSSTTTRVQHPLGCSPHTSYRWRGERVIEPIKCMRSPHTSYRWRAERVIEPIKCMRSPHTSYRWRGERVIEPIKCMRSPHSSYRWRGERVIEPIKCMRSPHTSYRWRGERVIEPIKCMRSPHTSYRWRAESHRANQVYALTTH